MYDTYTIYIYILHTFKYITSLHLPNTPCLYVNIDESIERNDSRNNGEHNVNINMYIIIIIINRW